MNKLNFLELSKSIDKYWRAYEVLKIDEIAFRLAKIKGEYPFHKHSNEDEFIYVIKGKVFVDIEDETFDLSEGEGILVPAGKVHRSRTEKDKEAIILLIEPVRTKTEGEF